MLLEQRAYQEGELPAKSKEPPDYDGKYTDQILDPLKHVCSKVLVLVHYLLGGMHVPIANVCMHGVQNVYRLHTKGEVAKSLGNLARGVQPACTMTTQKFKNQVDK